MDKIIVKKMLDKMMINSLGWGCKNYEAAVAPVRAVFYWSLTDVLRLPVSARAGALPIERRQVSGFFIWTGSQGDV